MEVNIGDIVSWLIIGILAGSLAGIVVTRSRTGLGHLTNLLVGLVGAVFGGIIVRVFKLDFDIGKVVLRPEDLVAAFIGALICIVIAGIIKKRA